MRRLADPTEGRLFSVRAGNCRDEAISSPANQPSPIFVHSPRGHVTPCVGSLMQWVCGDNVSLPQPPPPPIMGESWDGNSKSRRLMWDGRQPARTRAQEQRNAHCWKPLPSSAVKTVTEDATVCVTVTCEVWSRVVRPSGKSDYHSKRR
jgi:hypothetical protein